MNDDATQSGVPNEESTGEAAPREPSPRELAMEAIASGHHDRLEAELSQAGESTASTANDDQLAAQLDTSKPAEIPDATLIRVKIDGVESDVTVAEMRRQYQKNGAAERRLEEATRLLNEARAAGAAANPPLEIDPGARSNDSSPSAAPSSNGEADRKELLAAMFEGDEAKALEVMDRIGLGRQQPTQNTNQLVAQLTPAIKQQLVVESALDRFAVEYADIVKDPYLADLADRFLDEEVKGGLPFTEALEIAGKKTRDWLGSKGVKTNEPTPTTSRNTKLERKAGMDNLPALSSKATTVEEPEQSATDVINEMRKARGLMA